MGPLDDQVVRADSLTATPDGLDIAVYSHWYRALPLPSLARFLIPSLNSLFEKST